MFPPLEEKAHDMSRFEEDFVKFSEPSIDSLRLEKEYYSLSNLLGFLTIFFRKELERIRRMKAREQNSLSDSPNGVTRKKFV